MRVALMQADSQPGLEVVLVVNDMLNVLSYDRTLYSAYCGRRSAWDPLPPIHRDPGDQRRKFALAGASD
jgi:hypothetical protein